MFDRNKLNHWLARLLSSRRAALISAAALLAISLQVFADSYFNEETGLYEFQDGEVILAEEVNTNFENLSDQLKILQDQLVPPGTVIAFAGEVEPVGWMFCDGRALPREEFPALFASIGTSHGAPSGEEFNIPDYRGRFLRGVDGGSGRDPDAPSRSAATSGGNDGGRVGSVQGCAVEAHDHPVVDSGHSHGYTLTTIRGDDEDGGSMKDWPKTNSYSPATTATAQSNIAVGPRGGRETRPINAAVNYLIKY